MDAWRYYQAGGGGVQPRAVDIAEKRKPGADLYRRNREPRWRQPGIGIFSRTDANLTIDNWEGGNLGPMGPLMPYTPQGPSGPGNLVATALGVSQVKLTWVAAFDNFRASKYEVERKDPGSTRFVHLGTTTGTSYTDTGLAAGGNYSYRILARDARGRLKDYPGVASATTGSPTIVPRSAP